MADVKVPPWAEQLFSRIAVPRLPGSDAVRRVEIAIAEQLRAFGYAVTEEAFTARTHRLDAASVAGAGLAWVALGHLPLLVWSIPAWLAVFAGLLALLAVALVALAVVRRTFDRWPAGLLVGAVNLSATVRAADPRVWLVAHSDSKAQRVSLRGRVIAVLLLGVGTVGLLACLGVRMFGPLPALAVLPWIGCSVIGGAALAGRPVRDGSPGAVDNASGVIAALTAAEHLRHRTDVGVLITGAEEFGMEGARQWIRAARNRGCFVNFDGLDIRGRFNVMVHRGRGQGDGIDGPSLAASVTAELRRADHHVRTAPLPPGIFVDGAVLAEAGMPGVTLSRGDWSTLGVVHTEKDTVERTDVTYAVQAGLAVGSAVDRVLG